MSQGRAVKRTRSDLVRNTKGKGVKRVAINPTTSEFHHSRLIQVGHFLFLAGHVARENGTGEVKGDVREQTTEILRQFEASLVLAGASLDHLAKVNVYLARKDDFLAFDAVYSRYFSGPPPARTTVVAKLLPMHALIEMDGIACL